MASVWAAQHLSLRSEVAIKLIDPRIADQAEALQRFHREARAAANLRSNHIVQVFDHGIEEGVPFMVMELLRGENLAEYLEKYERMPAPELLRVMTHVGRAMARAHAAGITHRDLKPENIFLTQDEDTGPSAKVLDFGVAKINGQVGISHRFPTRSGVILGTPWYMSPEQMQGEGNVDHRSDLWAMGVIAFECLVGKRPFDEQALGKLAEEICRKPAPVPSESAPVPPEFDAWFAKAMAKRREERFESARELVEALDRALRPLIGPEARPSFSNWNDLEEPLSPLGGTAPEFVPINPKKQDNTSPPLRGAAAVGGGMGGAAVVGTSARPARTSQPAARSLPRLFLDGVLVCLATLLVAVAVFALRRTWFDYTDPIPKYGAAPVSAPAAR